MKPTDQSSGAVLAPADTTAPKPATEEQQREYVAEMQKTDAAAGAFGKALDAMSSDAREFLDRHGAQGNLIARVRADQLSAEQIQRATAAERAARHQFEYGAKTVAELRGQFVPYMGMATTSAGTSITATFALAIPEAWPGAPAVGMPEPDWSNYVRVVTRTPNLDRTLALLTQFGLDESRYGRSAAELLREAHKSLMNGAHGEQPITGVLIAARGAVSAAISALLQEREHQEKTKGIEPDLVSIGRQCGLAGLPDTYFSDLDTQWRSLNKVLSDAGKEKRIPRDGMAVLFDQVVQWLATLLEGLDPSQMKRLRKSHGR